jgi:hypothetical protein
LIPFVIYNFIAEIIIFFSTLSYAGFVNFTETTIIINTINAIILNFIDVLGPLFLTILILLNRKLRPASQTSDLMVTLTDPVLTEAFKTQCEIEFSVENYLCWKDIQEFKKTKKNAETFYANYLNGYESVMEVNIPRNCCLAVKAKMEKEYDENLLAEVEKQIVTNLSDTYSRFMRSDFYVDYVKKSQLTKELLEGKMDFSKGVTNTQIKVMLEKTNEIQMEQKRLTEVAEKMKQRENELNSMMQEKDHTISSLEKRLADQRMQIDQLKQEISFLKGVNSSVESEMLPLLHDPVIDTKDAGTNDELKEVTGPVGEEQ